MFDLLAHLTSDPELRQWAQDELHATNETIDLLTRQKTGLEDELGEAQTDVASANIRDNIDALDRRLGVPREVCSVPVDSDPPGATVTITRYGTLGEPRFVHVVKNAPTPGEARLRIGTYVFVIDKPGFGEERFTYSASPPDHCPPVSVKLFKAEVKSQAEAKPP